MSRQGSGAPGSFRSLRLAPLHMQSGEPHPEEWTLVGTHKMEKREQFDFWYADLQANILNCAKRINDLLESHPHPNANLTVNDIMHSRYVIDVETDRVMSDVYGRQPANDNPIFLKLGRDEEIRLYRGL